MRILFEEHQYKVTDVQYELKDICTLQDIDKNINVSYVGYFYNPAPEVRDCVFILPKVLLKDEKVVGEDGKRQKIEVIANIPKVKDENGVERFVTPEDVISPEGQKKYLTKEYRKFIYEFAVWIYRSLDVYRKHNSNTKAIYYKPLPQEGKGRRHRANTFLDILLSLIRFNQENQNFFLFTIKNLHSGNNKINWTRTITHSQSLVQGGSVVYLDPVNKKRQINYEEELFVIFFSILTYINDSYGFKAPVNCQYELITGSKFEAYMKGRGKVRLRQIRYKYFSDKTLQLWDLCYAFFDNAYQIAVNVSQQEYLLAKNFEIVFEAMIDDLIGDRDIPKGLKEQDDGKRVDHMYIYDGLTNNNDEADDIYYIGDSKYYKNGHQLGRQSIYKQYTYARNVIQWNIDLFMNGQHHGWTEKEQEEYEEDRRRYSKIRLRNDEQDPLTEGYDIIPNFFLSAYVDETRTYVEKNNIRLHEKNGAQSTHISYQFEDRLFDRDTLILSHYDVNFLYVVYLYARNKSGEKAAWRQKARALFRDEIRKVLQRNYNFYALRSKGNILAGEQFIKEHFKDLQGKLYRPYGDKNLYSLALKKMEGEEPQQSDVFKLLNEFFVIDQVELGENPKAALEQKTLEYQAQHPYEAIPQEWLPEYHLERYANQYILIGSYHGQAHWDWITGKNDRGSLIYNVRLDKSRRGAQVQNRIRNLKPVIAILFEEGHESDNHYHVFRIHDTAVMSEERMKKALYPGEPHGDYFIFRFDEEISIGKINLNGIISKERVDKANDFIEGAPIYLTGEDIMKFRFA